MSYFNCTVAYSTAGTKSIACGFAPSRARVTLSQKYTGVQPYLHYSMGAAGMVDPGTGTPVLRQHVDSVFQDSTGSQTVSSDSLVVSHQERLSGSIADVVTAAVSAFTGTGISFSVTTVTPNYNWFVELWS